MNFELEANQCLLEILRMTGEDAFERQKANIAAWMTTVVRREEKKWRPNCVPYDPNLDWQKNVREKIHSVTPDLRMDW